MLSNLALKIDYYNYEDNNYEDESNDDQRFIRAYFGFQIMRIALLVNANVQLFPISKWFLVIEIRLPIVLCFSFIGLNKLI